MTEIISVKRAVRVVISLSAIFAWLAISNHCALAAFEAPATATQHEDCPMHSAPKKNPAPKSSILPCCKILRATIAKTPSTFFRAIVDLPHVDLAFAPFVRFAPQFHLGVGETLDTGPPGKTKFVELTSSAFLRAPPANS